MKTAEEAIKEIKRICEWELDSEEKKIEWIERAVKEYLEQRKK